MALDLSAGISGMDEPTRIVRGGDLLDLYPARAKVGVHPGNLLAADEKGHLLRLLPAAS